MGFFSPLSTILFRALHGRRLVFNATPFQSSKYPIFNTKKQNKSTIFPSLQCLVLPLCSSSWLMPLFFTQVFRCKILESSLTSFSLAPLFQICQKTMTTTPELSHHYHLLRLFQLPPNNINTYVWVQIILPMPLIILIFCTINSLNYQLVVYFIQCSKYMLLPKKMICSISPNIQILCNHIDSSVYYI